jgi:hypothetical protein
LCDIRQVIIIFSALFIYTLHIFLISWWFELKRDNMFFVIYQLDLYQKILNQQNANTINSEPIGTDINGSPWWVKLSCHYPSLIWHSYLWLFKATRISPPHFIRYLLHLHFKCYPKSPLYPPHALLPYPPTPTSWPWCSPVLGHMKFAKPRGLSSQWWLTRPSSDTYAARDTSSGGTG